MVRTASAVAALVFASGLGGAALAEEPPAVPSPATLAPAPTTAPAQVAVAKTEPVAPVAVPMAAPVAPAAPSLRQVMQAQALADAPPPPAPPAAPLAAPSVAVAAEGLAPAAKSSTRIAFAAPPVAIAEAANAPIIAAVATPAPVQVAVAVPQAPAATAAAPIVVKVAVTEPAPTPVAAPAPRAAPSGAALVARRVIDAAGAFDAWTEKAGRIDGKFSDAVGVSTALTDTSAFQAQQLEEGAVAFGALAALQDPVFVQSAHELAAQGPDCDAAAAILLKDPSQVMSLPGADVAAAFAAQALSSRAQSVITAGKAVRRAAYSMQVDPWAKTAVLTPEKRLADAKARSSASIALDGPASELLMKRLVELRATRQSSASAPQAAPTPLVSRSLALAAMIVLGEADEAHSATLTPILSEGKSTDCLKMAKLNLFQCLSVAGPHYEDAFCVGQHGLGDAGQCIAAATGVSTPVVADPPVLIAAAGPPPSAGVSVPIALLAEAGPERSAAYTPAGPAPEAAAAPRAPMLLAQAAPVRSIDQPSWAGEPAPRAYARQSEDDDAAPPAPRVDRGLSYRWDRQQRAADYAAPGYAPQPYGYADPRQSYGRYAQPARPQAQPNGYGYDGRADEDDDAPPVDPRTLAPQRGYWGYR